MWARGRGASKGLFPFILCVCSQLLFSERVFGRRGGLLHSSGVLSLLGMAVAQETSSQGLALPRITRAMVPQHERTRSGCLQHTAASQGDNPSGNPTHRERCAPSSTALGTPVRRQGRPGDTPEHTELSPWPLRAGQRSRVLCPTDGESIQGSAPAEPPSQSCPLAGTLVPTPAFPSSSGTEPPSPAEELRCGARVPPARCKELSPGSVDISSGSQSRLGRGAPGLAAYGR